MYLRDLIFGIYDGKVDECYLNCEIFSLSCDSRTIQSGSLFVALAGAQYTGSDFIKDAILKGASVVVRSLDDEDSLALNGSVCILKVSDPRKFLNEIVLRFYGNPSSLLQVFGITGTNGKTTITYLLEAIAHLFQKKCAVIGTINYRIGPDIFLSKNTTPGFLENQKYLARLAQEKIDYCFMEVSSHALVQGRVDLIDFKTAIFTNLTGDHLDYHKTMENYFQAKSILFRQLSPNATAVINIDDVYGKKLLSLTQARILTYGLSSQAQVHVKNIKFGFSGSTMDVITPAGNFELKTPLIGTHNIYNVLAAVGAAVAQQIPLEIIKAGLECVALIPGRLEAVDCGQDFFVFIDYAHTEDGLKNVLQALRATQKAKLIVVFGCGGDRDRTKRPKMGKIACELADQVIITTDNPRSEDPNEIMKEIVSGFSKNNFGMIVDRTQAIHHALMKAKKGDVVLLAGKGHETYQIFKDFTIDYDERLVVRNFFKDRK